ncbi:TPA: YtjB family periplasmic protein [Photobacterium damselae]
MWKLNKSRWPRFKQLGVLLFSLIGVIGMLEYGARLTQDNYEMLGEQTQALSRILVRQAAETAAPDILDNDQDKLQDLVQQLSKEPLILDASVYNLEGQTLAKTEGSMPLEQVTGLSTPLAVASIGRQQIVEPIFSDQHMVGFLRITLEHNKLLAHASSQIEYMTTIIRGLVIFAIGLGFLLAFTFGRRKDIWHFPFLMTANSKE